AWRSARTARNWRPAVERRVRVKSSSGALRRPPLAATNHPNIHALTARQGLAEPGSQLLGSSFFAKPRPVSVRTPMKLVKGETKPGGKRNKPLRKGIAMRTLLTWTTALVIGLSANARTFAGGPGGKGGSGSHGSHGSHSSNGSNSSHAHVITGNHNSSYSLHHSFKNGSTKSATYHNYHLTHGKKLGKNGYCYPGKYHNHWKYCCFNFN